jgi:hypothetical protein
VPIEVFDVLDDGDILFIDSTHVSKPGSDVNWLFFRVLPRLKPGVVIHVHDIFYPFEYHNDWLTERRSWNESYLLRSFLSYNNTFQITFFSSWIWQEHPEVVLRHLPESKQPASSRRNGCLGGSGQRPPRSEQHLAPAGRLVALGRPLLEIGPSKAPVRRTPSATARSKGATSSGFDGLSWSRLRPI